MEIRKHYFLDEYVIIASERGKRPHQFTHGKEETPEVDFFAPGNENMTPPETYRFPESSTGKYWKIRAFPNKFAFLKPEGNPVIRTDNDLYSFSDAFGYHEVIVETPDIDKGLKDLEKDQMKEVFRTYKKRIEALSQKESIKYVLIFKNSGKDAGTSIVHSHTQVAATSIVPPRVMKKEEALDKTDKDTFQEIIDREKGSLRRCFENDRFISFTPYASRFAFETLVLPKENKLKLSEFDEKDYEDLSEIMLKILKKLGELNAPYNFYLHYGIDKMRFHIEITPRLAKWAGFELGSGIIVNSISPEDAARFYRGEEK